MQSTSKYPAKAHARRVAKKLGFPGGFVALEAAKYELYQDSDMPRPFRQARYFYYMSGCNEPDCYLIYNIRDDKLTLYLPPIDKARVVWTGRGSTTDEAMKKYDIDDAKYIRSKAFIEELSVSTNGPIFTLSQNLAIDDDQYHAKATLLQRSINACRVIKDSYEINLIAKANDITADGHINVLEKLHSFTNESEVEAAYMSVCIANHAREQSYEPIAGSGPNGATLHYVKNDADFGDSQTMVLDAGCEYKCYASDVTRSFPLNHKNPGVWPSSEAKRIYKLVERMQEACINKMKPGNKFVDIHALSNHIAVDGLLELGVLKGNHDEIYKAGTQRGFYPHGLGHHMGLEVHDVSPDPPPPATLSEENAAPFAWDFNPCNVSAPAMEPGMIITVEPGIYFNADLLETFFLDDDKHRKFIDHEVLKQYMHVGGIRIEDDILITKDGYENLTTAPKGDDMLELIRSSAMASRA